MRKYFKLKNDLGKNLVAITVFLFAGFLIGSILPRQNTIVITPAIDTHQFHLQRLNRIQQTVLRASSENLMYSVLSSNCHSTDLQNLHNFVYPDEHPLFVQWENEVSDKLTYVPKEWSHLESTNGKLVPPCFPYSTHCTNKGYAYPFNVNNSHMYTKTILRDYQVSGKRPALNMALDPDFMEIAGDNNYPTSPLRQQIPNIHHLLPTVQNNIRNYSPVSDCCIIEIRSYDLLPEKGNDFHKLIVHEVAPMLERWDTDLVSYGQSYHNKDAYYAIRAYNNLAEREQKHQDFYGSAEWRHGPRDSILSMIESYTTVTINTDPTTIDAIRLNFNKTNQ